MTFRRRTAYGFLLVLLITAAILVFFSQTILTAVGTFLVDAQPPQRADVILVLAGDWTGCRIVRAVELVKAGYAPKALVSGPMALYGVNEATLAVQYAIQQGAPPEIFEPVVVRARSTVEEAKAFAPILRKRNVRKLLLLTSNYHTRRASAIFRNELGSEVDVRTVSAPDPYFTPDAWWQHREGQKTLFYEYSKTLANWLGI